MSRGKTSTRAGSAPRYAEIARDIERAILSGAWPPGHRVPPETELTLRYGCARMTVNRALLSLVNAGMIERRRRIGTVVAKPGGQSAVIEVRDIKTEILAIGAAYGYRLIDRRLVKASETEGRRIGVPRGRTLLRLVALHLSDGKPFALETRWINIAEVPGADAVDFSGRSAGGWLIEHVPWTDAEHRISATEAGAEEVRHLLTKRGAACLVMERRTWRRGGPITFARFVFPGDRHHFVARFTPRLST